MVEIMQEAGRWTCVWSGGSLGVSVVLAASALDVRRLRGMLSVSLRGFGPVEGAASFRTEVVAGAVWRPVLRVGLFKFANRLEVGKSGQCPTFWGMLFFRSL